MPTKLYNLQSFPKTKPKKRVGRGNGSGKGTYSTRGIKGQRARSGGKKGLRKRSLMKQLIKKMPKIGGFKSSKPKSYTITLSMLDNSFKDNEKVSLNLLKKKGLVPRYAKKAKIVATGRIRKKLIIDNTNIKLSKQAKELLH